MTFTRKAVKWSVVIIALICCTTVLSVLAVRYHRLKNTQSYFDNLDEALKFPDQVKILILRNQRIDSLPEAFGELKNIRVLNLANSHLKALPESIGNLSNLEALSVDNNELSNLPVSIRNLKRLKIVNLSTNHFKTLPLELFKLDSLGKLNLSNNQIEKVDFSGFSAMEELDLSENGIIELPSLSRLRLLKKLDLYKNKIRTVPEKLFDLPLLNELILSENPLDEHSQLKYNNFLDRRAIK